MQQLTTLALAAAVLGLFSGAALASQDPGVSAGTAGPFAQWMAFVCFIGFATLGVVFSAWDDGTYGLISRRQRSARAALGGTVARRVAVSHHRAIRYRQEGPRRVISRTVSSLPVSG